MADKVADGDEIRWYIDMRVVAGDPRSRAACFLEGLDVGSAEGGGLGRCVPR